jgi:hypothetical protein
MKVVFLWTVFAEMTTNQVKNDLHNASNFVKYGKAYIDNSSINIVGQNIIRTLFI